MSKFIASIKCRFDRVRTMLADLVMICFEMQSDSSQGKAVQKVFAIEVLDFFRLCLFLS